MTMPIPQAFSFVYLGNEDGNDLRDTGARYFDFFETNTSKPYQGNFLSYNMDFTTYPQELVRRLIRAPNTQAVALTFCGGFESTYISPGDVVTSYEPGIDPVPDPNGNTSNRSIEIEDQGRGISDAGGDNPLYYPAPRYHTDSPYDLKDSLSEAFNLMPLTGLELLADDPGDLPYSWSVDLTVETGDSKVLNVDSDEYEYYPFTLTTASYYQTAKFRPDYYQGYPFGSFCCPIKNAVINGKASVWSVSVNATRSNPDSPFFNGINVEIGSSYTEEMVLDWTMTFDPDNPTPDSVEIPTVAGKITFINDWWIESIDPPAE
jgi:hypothetical protein